MVIRAANVINSKKRCDFSRVVSHCRCPVHFMKPEGHHGLVYGKTKSNQCCVFYLNGNVFCIMLSTLIQYLLIISIDK